VSCETVEIQHVTEMFLMFFIL